jgi:death on curing protein
MISLTKAEVLELHQQLTHTFGGDGGMRAERLLDGTLTAVERSMAANADLGTCAAALAYHLTLGRAFVEGNTRLAAAATELFILLNDGQLAATNDELLELFGRIAAGDLSRRAVERSFGGWVNAPGASKSGKGPSSMKDTLHDHSGAAAAAEEPTE